MVIFIFLLKILNKLISGFNYFIRNYMLYWMNKKFGVEVLCEMCFIVKLCFVIVVE